ncbi:anti-sigma regulatory factor [Allokutzneria sp. A3M-2-11 16]|uniref:anti-sigma regulatory factor n=1 Tax=Allokutzneria sp. A3M-2-11 16 TaxID=2962043 RepID=UPI0020B6FD3B|nr:anti-sigma regulatory factor [Allokutzneria sp. A3M-2-11 16]MCP3801086.1 anti-sigma regulatory factor [Allokutzneria sp. A3M-2-11 16]
MSRVLAADTMPIRSEGDIVGVRQLVRQHGAAAELSLVEQTKLVTAASELARNTLLHGGGGKVEVESVEEDRRRTIRLSFIDSGPGIEDVELALTDGYTTAGGLGLGLGGTRRLAGEFEIDSVPGEGTTVTVRFHTRVRG